jgi:cytoskeletal protein RodZ
MREIGDTLKQKREANKFSREFVNSQTHIPLKYIIAMEEWNISVFPAEVYLKGFMRIYSEYLGLNSNEIIEDYKKSK